MLATLDDSKPIWDRNVLHFLEKTSPVGNAQQKLDGAKRLYVEIEKWYKAYMETAAAKENIRVFDELLPDCVGISGIKKIDCLIWACDEK